MQERGALDGLMQGPTSGFGDGGITGISSRAAIMSVEVVIRSTFDIPNVFLNVRSRNISPSRWSQMKIRTTRVAGLDLNNIQYLGCRAGLSI